MSAADDERKLLADWYRSAINDARGGNRAQADGLLRDFALLAADGAAFDHVGGPPTELVQYVATCLADWRKRKYRDAETWFNIERPDHRPAAAVSGVQVRAMRAYMVFLARGWGVEASISGAKNYSGLTQGQVRHVIETHPERDTLKDAVMFLVTPRLRTRLMRPAPRKKPR